MKGQGRVVEPVVRVNLDEMIARGERIVVDVGCGNRKKAGRIGIDRVDLEGVDIVADLEQGLQFFPDASVDEIHCRSVLEHVEDMKGLLGEMLRVLKPQGQAHIFGRITRIRSPGGGAVRAQGAELLFAHQDSYRVAQAGVSLDVQLAQPIQEGVRAADQSASAFTGVVRGEPFLSYSVSGH